MNDSSLSAKYTGGASGGQGATAALFVPGGLVFFVTGATGADAAGSGSQQGSGGSTSLTAADAHSTVTTTPLVYQPGSDDGPGVVLGVWTGDEGGAQFIPVSDMEDAYDDGAPDGALQPFFLPGVDGYTGHAGMGPPNWGDGDPGFRVSDAEAAKRLTGLAKMIYDHGLPVSSRYADSGGRVIVYSFADGSRYMEPVEPPSEQHLDSAAAMIPGGIALRSGKGAFVASRAIAAEAIEDAIANRAGQAASAASGGYLSWVPAPILSILFGAKLKTKPGVVDDAAEAAKDASTAAAKNADDMAQVTGHPLGNVPHRAPRVGSVLGLPDDVATQVDEAISRASQGQVRFPGHDGKPYLNRDGLLPARSDYTEWTAAPSGARRGAHRIIIAGDPARPDAVYYWDHVNPPVQIWP